MSLRNFGQRASALMKSFHAESQGGESIGRVGLGSASVQVAVDR
jgi:hypothetical protein